MTARLILFGSPALEAGGESFGLANERRHQLLAYLALKRSWVARTELAAMLWPEQEDKLAFTNLRVTLFRLQSLPWASAIDVQGGVLRWQVETDVSAFEAALRERRIADALALRRGELLAGFDDDANDAWSSWLAFERDRLRVAWRDAALSHLDSDFDAAQGIELSALLLGSDPLDEAALRAHMTWLARSGQGARARQAYRDFSARLAEDLGLTPGSELKALHDSLGAARPAGPAATVKPGGNDRGFVGRTVELQRIGSLLAQGDCRLLCLVGPGGVGKTRLAQRALDQFAPQHDDGAAFVALEDVASGQELGAQLAHDLGIGLNGGSEPLEQVIEWLRERQMLLVLDNFEQVAADAPVLDRLLAACPRLKIIATSRVRLAAAAAWVLPLEGLPCPEAADQDRFESFDAARLFVQAARRVEPALVSAVESAAIVEICRLVEGLPLALELAATWTRVLSCDAIAAELRRGTELLQAVDASHPSRHASIEVVFEQSWQLLGASERNALARLSVFRGGFSADVARAVAAASLPVLGALADKSLLRKEGARLFLHPLVQQLAARRLVDGRERAATERAHALHFHRQLSLRRRATTDGNREALDWLATEHENCRIAWRWAIAHDAADLLTQSVPTWMHFCDHRGRCEEGLSLLGGALEVPSVVADAKLQAPLLAALAHLAYRLDRYAQARASAELALEAARDGSDHDTLLQSFKVLAGCALRVGQLGDAKRFYEQALAQAPESSHPHSTAGTLDNLALVEKNMGHYDEALRLSIQSLTQHRRLGDAAGEALCLNNLGALVSDQGQQEAAGAHLREGLAVCDRHGLTSTRGLILANLTGLSMKVGDLEAAQAHGQRALEAAESSGNQGVTCWLKLQFVRLRVRRGDWPAARAELASGLGIAVALGRISLQLDGVAAFAELLRAQGDASSARRLWAFAAQHPSASPAQRDDLRALLAQPPASDAPAAWPGIGLDELVHRLVAEAGIAHVPLLGVLRAAA